MEKPSKYGTWDIVPNILGKDIRSMSVYPVQITSTSPEPKTKNQDCRELSEKSWFLVSCFHGCTGIYRPLTVWMFLANVQVRYLCFLKMLELSMFMDFPICVFVIFWILTVFAILFFDEMCFLLGFCHGFISLKKCSFLIKKDHFSQRSTIHFKNRKCLSQKFQSSFKPMVNISKLLYSWKNIPVYSSKMCTADSKDAICFNKIR